MVGSANSVLLDVPNILPFWQTLEQNVLDILDGINDSASGNMKLTSLYDRTWLYLSSLLRRRTLALSAEQVLQSTSPDTIELAKIRLREP